MVRFTQNEELLIAIPQELAYPYLSPSDYEKERELH